jgi:ribosomal protein S27E
MSLKVGKKFVIPVTLKGKTEMGCGHEGRIVWISTDGGTIAVKCEKCGRIQQMPEGGAPVYLVDVREEATSAG